MKPPAPVSLKGSDTSLTIEWDDGVRHELSWSLLRNACPCATCRDKRDKPPSPSELLPVLSPAETVPPKAVEMLPMGNYAYGIHFNDGHNTGIYTFELLRELGGQA